MHLDRLLPRTAVKAKCEVTERLCNAVILCKITEGRYS